MREPYDWDAYAETFFPTAEELVRRATEAEKAEEKEKASELYLYGMYGGFTTLPTDARQASICRVPHLPLPKPTINQTEICLDDGKGSLSERPSVWLTNLPVIFELTLSLQVEGTSCS